MFRHLRNRLIFISLAVTTIVLVVAFSSIYLVALNEARRRQEAVTNFSVNNTYIVVRNFSQQIIVEQKQALRSLLASLLVAGIAVESAVAILAYVLAEEAIRPIKEAYDAQRTFVANASHEMKTPIAAIMANLEVADIHDNPWINNVDQEINYMNTLNQELLTLARAESSISSVKDIESVILKNFVEEIISPLQPRIKSKKIHFTFKTQLKSTRVKLAKNDFKQIVTILLDNAIKYGKHNITLTLTSKSLSLENDGATISAENLPHIFDRFYQTDKSSEGVGLGLAIAKTLADRNDWKLSVKSNKTTEFTLNF